VVESHPVALAQCEQFFVEHPRLKPHRHEDTAGSVRAVVLAAMCIARPSRGGVPAEIYGGTILAEHLEDNAENYTRFWLLPPSPDPNRKTRTSFAVLSSWTRPGALLHALEPFGAGNII